MSPECSRFPADVLDYETVEDALLAWELATTNGRSVVNSDLVGLWVAILMDERVTRSEFQCAAIKVVKTALYGLPKPADLLRVVHSIRENERKANRFPLTLAIDAMGREVAVRADRVDGVEFTPIPPPMPALPAPPMTPEEVEAKLRGMSAIGRRAFVRQLRMSGIDVSAEDAALARIEADDRASASAQADRRDAEQAARVRAQAEAIRERKGVHA